MTSPIMTNSHWVPVYAYDIGKSQIFFNGTNQTMQHERSRGSESKRKHSVL